MVITLHVRKRTRLVESRDSDLRKVISNAAPEGRKTSTKFAVNARSEN